MSLPPIRRRSVCCDGRLHFAMAHTVLSDAGVASRVVGTTVTVKQLYVGYLAAGGLALVLALFSYQVRRIPVSGPLLALGLGVLAGPEVLAVLTVPESVLEPLTAGGCPAHPGDLAHRCSAAISG